MPAYLYTGEDARYYPTLALHAEPGLVVELDDRPAPPGEGEEPLQQPEGARWVPDDGRWEPTKKKPTPPPADPVPAEPAADTAKES